MAGSDGPAACRTLGSAAGLSEPQIDASAVLKLHKHWSQILEVKLKRWQQLGGRISKPGDTASGYTSYDTLCVSRYTCDAVCIARHMS